jgi:predicted DNA-binding transcriptional regulator AlpA
MHPQQRLRTPEAATYVGLSPSTLQKLRLTGNGPAYHKAGPKIVVYSVEDLDAWLRGRRHTSTSDIGSPIGAVDRAMTASERDAMDRIEFSKRPRRSHIFARDRDDFYSEPSWVSERLFAAETFEGLIWDPACGLGTIPRAARAAGLSNFASDIADHGYGVRQDFLKATAPTTHVFNVLTNPPFMLTHEFVEHALALGAAKVAIIFPVARLNAAHWLTTLPLARVWLLTPRPSMPPGRLIANGEKPGGGKTDFCWSVFDRTHTGSPMLGWLQRDGGKINA